ncbi:MAG: hypothetical protein VKI83_11925 [Synechococcaceae cyanobacterium]|nr:hypothetical protein [Synechococcaceae cyanobacterium]
MAPLQHWSLVVRTARSGRPRWLGVNGRITSDPGLALRLVSPEVAARRVQLYMDSRGWGPEVMERFHLVPSPPLNDERSARQAA